MTSISLLLTRKYKLSKLIEMTTREIILELVADKEQSDNELTDKLLSLYSVVNLLKF